MTAPTDILNTFPQESELLPDPNSAQAIAYGSAYKVMSNILWAWDAMEDHLIRRSQELESQLMDREWCFNVLKRNRYLIFAQSPPVNEVEHLKDLQVLRQLCKVQAAIHKIDEFRQKNIAWGRMQGTKEYVSGLEGQGISESRWKASTCEWNTKPINYRNVKYPEMDPEDDIDWDEAYRDLIGAKNYDKLIKKFDLGDEDGGGDEETDVLLDGEIWGSRVGESQDADAEDGESDLDGEEEVEEESEEESEEDEPEVRTIPDLSEPSELSDGFSESLAVMFDDPVGDLMNNTRSDEEDVSDYLKRADLDNRAIIDWLIECAEAARCRRGMSPNTRKQSPI